MLHKTSEERKEIFRAMTEQRKGHHKPLKRSEHHMEIEDSI